MTRGLGQRTELLIRAAAAILEQIQPATVRAVCYRLFVAGLIASMSKNETNKVSRALVTGREQRLIPWDWIVDETRDAERPGTWRNPAEIIDATVRGYRRDRWQNQSEWVEVWSEKGTVRGTLAPVLHDFGITFRVTHGYSSATLLNDVAAMTADRDRLLTVLYVGDFDPSGMHMSEVDLPQRLERYGADVQLRRIALLPEDTDQLPGFPLSRKVNDPRHRWFAGNHGLRFWELDAMPPPDLRRSVEGAIRGLIDMDAWDHDGRVEEAEIGCLRTFHAAWTERISRPASK
jgi:hypothetical protein